MKALLASLITLALISSVSAQQAVEKSWGDWSKVCTQEQELQICRIVQAATQNESGQRIFQTAIGYVADNDKPMMFLTGPLGIFLPRGISVVVNDDKPIPVVVQRCDSNGCLGVLPMDESLVAAMSKGAEVKLLFAASIKQNMALALSMDGFKSAFNAL